MPFPTNHSAVMVAAVFFLAGCTGQSDDSLARFEIEAAIARGVEATRTQDIDAYMALIPEDAVLHDAGGAIIARDDLRANALRDWSIIPKTLSISVAIDSIAVNGDTV